MKLDLTVFSNRWPRKRLSGTNQFKLFITSDCKLAGFLLHNFDIIRLIYITEKKLFWKPDHVVLVEFSVSSQIDNCL